MVRSKWIGTTERLTDTGVLLMLEILYIKLTCEVKTFHEM
jgi:hypothetical protein